MPPRGNPRTGFDQEALAGLAASVRTDGVLQNLVVRPLRGKKNRYRIVSGERRYRALKLLAEQGEIGNDYAVPVEIRERLSKDDALRIATIENVQRENLAPLDEAAAFAGLIHKGTSLDDIEAETGLSRATIKRRLALNGLCAEAKDALTGKQITLALAEALTLGAEDAQRRVLECLGRGYGYDADDIRETLTGGKPSVVLAIFPLEEYIGSFTTDLFANEETTYFDDADQFFALQREAVDALAAHHREHAAWVEITEDHRARHWLYEQAADGVQGGVLINFAPSGAVEIHEGLAVPAMDEDTAAELGQDAAAPAKPKPAYAGPLRRYIAWHKSMAVQEVLLADPRKAKEVAAVRLLLSLKPHEALSGLSKAAQPQQAYQAVEGQARHYTGKLGVDAAEDAPAWAALADGYHDAIALYGAVKALTDHDLDELTTLLTVLSFGQGSCEQLDTGDSLFNVVAQDLDMAMRGHWMPDFDFLNRRTAEQLKAIATGCGYAEGVGSVARYKKSELVAALLRHFQYAQEAADPTAAQVKAREWLPEIMRFPAIDPDASGAVTEDSESV
jgi:ParB family chromosome partitioning protein